MQIFIGELEDGNGDGAIGLQYSQSGNNISGQFSEAFADPNFDNSGTVTGTISGGTMTATVTSALQGGCTISLRGSLTGVFGLGYAESNCATATSGTIFGNTYSPVSIGGGRFGEENDSLLGTINLSIDPIQDGISLGGQWSTFPLGGSQQLAAGALYGQMVNDDEAVLVLAPSGSGCQLVSTVYVLSYGGYLNGQYVGHNCSQAESGSFGLGYTGGGFTGF